MLTPKIKVEITKADVEGLFGDLFDAENEGDRVEAFAEFLDAVTPAGPLEAFDGPAYLWAVGLIAKAAHRDPEKVAARKAKRAARKAARNG